METKVAALRESLKGDDLDAVKAGAEALAETLSRVGTAAYQAASAADESGGFDPTGQGGAGSAGAGSAGAGSAGAGSDEANGTGPAGAADGEETVEGEFKEV